MSRDKRNAPSLGIGFFGAVRDLNRVVNTAFDKAKSKLTKQGIFGVSASNLVILQIMTEFEGASTDPLKLAEYGMMDKGAFNRGLERLHESGFVKITKQDNKITKAALTDEGRNIGNIIQDELNASARELLGSAPCSRLVAQIAFKS